MLIPVLAIPVRCPKCGAVGLSEFPVVVVAIALNQWNNMCLYAPCHEGTWDASEDELAAIRRYLAARSERENRRRVLASQMTGVNFAAFSTIQSRLRDGRDLN